MDLVGFTGSGLSHTNWVGFRENAPERLDRLIGEGKMAPVVVAFPDCFTRLGGNQYINSAAMGAWEDYLIGEMLPAVEKQFACGGEGPARRFRQELRRLRRHSPRPQASGCVGGARPATPATWHLNCAICPICPPCLQELAKAGGSVERWWTQLEAAPKQPDKAIEVINILGDGRQL